MTSGLILLTMMENYLTEQFIQNQKFIKNITELPDYDLLKEKIKSMENITTNED